MELDFNSEQTPEFQKIFGKAIEDGKQWGHTFVSDPSWQGSKGRMSDHAIYEATVWSIGAGIATGACGIAGIPVDLINSLYSQVKLSSALFTIHGYDTSDDSLQVMIIAAAAGMKITELATHLGTKAATQAIQKALIAKPFRILMQINKPLALKLISQFAGKNVAKALQVMPAVGGVIGGGTNAVMMNVCGHGVLAYIKSM